MILTFCGHGDVYNDVKVREWLEQMTTDLIQNGAIVFYMSGYGSFDYMAKSVLIEQRKVYRHIVIV